MYIKGGCSNYFSYSFIHLTTDTFLTYKYLYVTIFKIQISEMGVADGRVFACLPETLNLMMGLRRKAIMW